MVIGSCSGLSTGLSVVRYSTCSSGDSVLPLSKSNGSRRILQGIFVCVRMWVNNGRSVFFAHASNCALVWRRVIGSRYMYRAIWLALTVADGTFLDVFVGAVGTVGVTVAHQRFGQTRVVGFAIELFAEARRTGSFVDFKWAKWGWAEKCSVKFCIRQS